MERVVQKRKARHLRSKAARHHKFISLYVMNNNKDVYDEAKKLYDELNMKYPGKRDLTKTDEFMQRTTGYTIHQMYQINQQTKKTPRSGNENGIAVVNKDDVELADIALDIPLMNKDDVELAVIGEKVSNEISIPDFNYNQLVEEISNDQSMSNIFSQLNQKQTEELDEILDELDGILPDEKSQLEEELENIVYE